MLRLLCAVILLSSCGKQGEKGEKGDSGPAGANGTGVSVSSGFSCTKISGSISVEYKSVLFTNGDRWAACVVENTKGTSSSNSVYFKTGQNGTASAACIVVHDIDTPATYGWWYFSIENGVKKSVFNKTGSPNHLLTITIDTCVSF